MSKSVLGSRNLLKGKRLRPNPFQVIRNSLLDLLDPAYRIGNSSREELGKEVVVVAGSRTWAGTEEEGGDGCWLLPGSGRPSRLEAAHQSSREEATGGLSTCLMASCFGAACIATVFCF